MEGAYCPVARVFDSWMKHYGSQLQCPHSTCRPPWEDSLFLFIYHVDMAPSKSLLLWIGVSVKPRNVNCNYTNYKWLCVCVCGGGVLVCQCRHMWEEDEGEEQHNNHQTCFFLAGEELCDKACQGCNQVNM